MIVLGDDRAAGGRATGQAFDDESVGTLRDPRAGPTELARQRGDAVRLLDAQLGRDRRTSSPLRARRGDGQRRDLVDGPQRQLAGDAVPRSELARARTRPTGSPIASATGSMVRSAPIARSTSSAPARVGLRPTFSMTTSLPGTTSAATIRNVADERSPGMVSAVALRRPFQPVGSTTIAPLGAVVMGAPRNPSIRSV